MLGDTWRAAAQIFTTKNAERQQGSEASPQKVKTKNTRFWASPNAEITEIATTRLPELGYLNRSIL